MPVIGEAWYELSARDEKLMGALRRAEGKAVSSGQKIEDAAGGAFDRGAVKGEKFGGRMAGVFNRIGTGFTNLGARFSGSPIGGAFDKLGAGADKASAGLDRASGAGGRFGGVLSRLVPSTSKFSGIMSNLGTGVLQGVGIAGFMGVTMAASALVGGLGSAISAASDLSETVSKVGVVFGDSAPEVLKFGENAAISMGMSKNAALGAAGTFGNLFVAMDVAQPKAAEMSTSMVKLAGDLASFNNVSPEEALEALRSGLVGESEPLRRFGIQLSEARIQAKAMELGLWSGKGTIDAAAKSQAAYALILEDSTTAQGDFARTSSGLANQQRIASARMEDAMAKLGATIVPIASAVLPMLVDGVVGVVTAIGDVIRGFQTWMAENKEVADVLGFIGNLIGTVLVMGFQQLAGAVSGAFGIIGSVISGAFGFIRDFVSFFLQQVNQIADVAASIPGPWQDAAKSMQATLQGMRADVDGWGKETGATTDAAMERVVESAKTAGNDAPPALAGGLAAGTPGVAAAAGDLADSANGPLSQMPKTARKWASDATDELADGIEGGWDDTRNAWNDLKDAMKHPMSETKRIARLEGILSSKRLAEGLASNDPLVRRKAEHVQQVASTELAALKADALGYGSKTTSNFGAGLTDPKVIAELKRQASYVSGVVKDRLQVRSPAKEGPFHELGGPEGWGERWGSLYVKGLSRGLASLTPTISSIMPSARVAVDGSVMAQREATLRIVVEDKDGGLARAGVSASDVAAQVRYGMDATGFVSHLRHVAAMEG